MPLLYALLSPLAVALRAPQFAPRAAQVRASATVNFEQAKSEAALAEAAAFFVDSFWAASTATTAVALTAAQRSQLESQQLDDMEARYAELVGKRRLESALWVARDPASSAIIGCVGCEVAVVKPSTRQVLPRRYSESLFTSALGEMGARERNELRSASLEQLAATLLPPGHFLCAVLSNLAVSPNIRRGGLGRQLCERCEEAAREWGFNGLMLQVEEGNAAARGLYEGKLGYRLTFADDCASGTRVVPDGAGVAIEDVPVTLLTLGKQV